MDLITKTLLVFDSDLRKSRFTAYTGVATHITTATFLVGACVFPMQGVIFFALACGSLSINMAMAALLAINDEGDLGEYARIFVESKCVRANELEKQLNIKHNELTTERIRNNKQETELRQKIHDLKGANNELQGKLDQISDTLGFSDD